jgi:hypothetical protein
MTKDRALKFLSMHQPMPADCDLTQEIIDEYDDVRKFFIEHPDKEAITLFMRSYGDGDGWGVYQLVEDVFFKCNFDDVVLSIQKILEDSLVPKSVRFWVTQHAGAFPDKRLLKGVNISLESDDEDTRDMALMALDFIQEQE